MCLLGISVHTDTAQHLTSNYWSLCLVANKFDINATLKFCRCTSRDCSPCLLRDCADMNFLAVYVRKTFFHVHLSRDGEKDTVQSTGTLWDEVGVTGLVCMP